MPRYSSAASAYTAWCKKRSSQKGDRTFALEVLSPFWEDLSKVLPDQRGESWQERLFGEGREARAAVMGEPLPERGLGEEDIEEMPSDLPMMTEEDFMMEYDLDEDEDA